MLNVVEMRLRVPALMIICWHRAALHVVQSSSSHDALAVAPENELAKLNDELRMNRTFAPNPKECEPLIQVTSSTMLCTGMMRPLLRAPVGGQVAGGSTPEQLRRANGDLAVVTRRCCRARKNDVTSNYYNLIGLSGAVPDGVSIDIVDPFNVFAADTREKAELLASSQQQAFVALRTGNPGPLPPPVADIGSMFFDPRIEAMLKSVLSLAQVGSPETIKAGIEAFIAEHRPDELMVTGQIYDHAARLRSYEILSRV